jgi:hypothetical protein
VLFLAEPLAALYLFNDISGSPSIQSTMAMIEETADQGPALLILGWVLTTISVAMVGLRCYTRITRVQRVAVHDFLMLTSLVSMSSRIIQYKPLS